MSGVAKQQQKGQGQPQKRKAEQQGAGSQPKKQKETAEPQAKKPAQTQQQNQPKKGGDKKPAQKKQPEPEPEEEEDEDEDEDEDEAAGDVDEAGLAAVDKLQPKMQPVLDELEAYDDQMNQEIYAIQKKWLLKKRPILAKRDELLKQIPKLWKRLFSEHMTFTAQMEEVDHEILDHLVTIEEQQDYTDATDPKQQMVGSTVFFTFTNGKHTKAGRYAKKFVFNDKTENLEPQAVAAKDTPFKSADFSSQHPDSFFGTWFASEGADEGIMAAFDALSSELLVDPLQLYAHVASGNPMPSHGSDDDDDDGMLFGEDGEEFDEDAPELVD